MNLFKYRGWLLGVSTAIFGAYLWHMDRTNGALFALYWSSILGSVVAGFIALYMRKLLFNYGDADLSDLFTHAKKSSTGAGLLVLALSIFTSTVFFVVGNFAMAN